MTKEELKTLIKRIEGIMIQVDKLGITANATEDYKGRDTFFGMKIAFFNIITILRQYCESEGKR